MARVPGMPASAEIGPLGVDDHESVGARHRVKPGTRAHALGRSHAAMQRNHGGALRAICRRVHEDGVAFDAFHAELDRAIRGLRGRGLRRSRGRLRRFVYLLLVAKRLAVERPVVVAERLQHALRVMLDALEHDPLVRDLQRLEMPVERNIVLVGLVLVADHHADERPLGDRLRVRLRERARTHLEKLRLRGAVDARHEFLGLHLACARRARQRFLHRSGAHDRDCAEHLWILEPEPRSAVAAHAVAVEQASFARCDRAIGRIDLGHEILDDHGLNWRGAVRPIDIHAHLEAVHKDDKARRRLARLDCVIEALRNRRDARQPATRAMQPVDDRKAPLGFALVRGRGVEVVADLGLGRRAVESLK